MNDDVQAALDLMAKDPVRGFIAIPIAGAQPPSRSIIVPLSNKRQIMLPDWEPTEWVWWGDLANDFASKSIERVRGRGGADRLNADTSKHLTRLSILRTRMVTVGRSEAGLLPQYYEQAVKTMIAAVSALTAREAGPLFKDELMRQVPLAPQVIKDALARAVGAGRDAIVKIAKEAGRVAGSLGAGVLAGLGVGGTIALGIGLYLAFGRRT